MTSSMRNLGKFGLLINEDDKKLFESTYENISTHLHEELTADSIEKRTKGLWRLEKAVLAVLGNFSQKMADSENTQSKSAKRMFST